jgi:hypothetical protein
LLNSSTMLLLWARTRSERCIKASTTTSRPAMCKPGRTISSRDCSLFSALIAPRFQHPYSIRHSFSLNIEQQRSVFSCSIMMVHSRQSSRIQRLLFLRKDSSRLLLLWLRTRRIRFGSLVVETKISCRRTWGTSKDLASALSMEVSCAIQDPKSG